MALINLKKKEVECKIVYYGPGRCGKTTNLEYVFKNSRKLMSNEMVSIKTKGDMTIFFDFVPMDAGRIKGLDVRVQLYTVPGQVKYNSTRKLVLKGVDGVVFVADASEEQREKNIESLNNLQENLLTYNLDIFKIPLVLQYNKVDLKQAGIPVMDSATLQKDLN